MINQSSRKFAAILIGVPIPLLKGSLVGYAVATFLLNELQLTDGPVALVVSLIFSLLGIVAVLGILGTIGGAAFLLEKDSTVPAGDPRSGKGKDAIIPPEIKGWNWGAAGIPTVWGVYHLSIFTVLAFIPVISWFWWIVMGIKGNEWAWRNITWESVEAFQKSQARWKFWGMLGILLRMAPLIIFIGFFIANRV